MPAELGDVSTGRLQASQVRSMFDRVAGVYDLLNTVMTAGLHHRWRARAADMARVGPGDRVLDVATGTGDLAIELARRVSPGGEVVGSDFSEVMLAKARAKGERVLDGGLHQQAPTEGGVAQHPSLAAHDGSGGHEPVASLDGSRDARPVSLCFEWGDALELPYEDDTFDAATVGFGARNFSDLRRGIDEMVRVVRPGGRVVVLEMTTPRRFPLSLFYGLWFDRMVPVIGKLAAAFGALSRTEGGPSRTTIAQAYAYLPNSVKRFHSPQALAAELEDAGCREISYVLMAGGIIAAHGATVPEIAST